MTRYYSVLSRRIGAKKLNEIQAQVETLQTPEKLIDKETMDTVKRLIDYHNQIKNTPNSALNIRASLNFLNSLLLSYQRELHRGVIYAMKRWITLDSMR